MRSQLRLLLAGILIFCSVSVYAQIDVGFITSLNSANFNVAAESINDWDYGARTGYGIGGVLAVHVPGIINVQIEPMYMKRGTTVLLQNIEFSHYDLNYIDIPLLFRFSINVPPVKPFFVIGTDFSYMVSATMKPSANISFEDDEGNFIDSFDVLNEFKRFDIGMDFGGGLLFPAGNQWMFVEILFGLGFRDIYLPSQLASGQPDVMEGADTVTNQDVKIKAGIIFTLKEF